MVDVLCITKINGFMLKFVVYSVFQLWLVTRGDSAMAQSSQVTLDIDSDGAEESASNTRTNLLRVEPGARPAPPARGHLGLGDRLNSVFREIRPLVEHARMVRLVRSSNVVNNMPCSCSLCLCTLWTVCNLEMFGLCCNVIE